MSYRFLCVLVSVCLIAAGCSQSVLLRGEVRDISGEPLPGVVVRVAGTDDETLTNANGAFSLRSGSGELQLDFLKTGYTPSHIDVPTPSLGIVSIDTVQLWPLPLGEGVYLYQAFRYHDMEHPRANRYYVEGGNTAFGTPVDPKLRFLAETESTDPPSSARLIAHRLPPYDVRLSRLRQVNASKVQVAGFIPKTDKKLQYTEPIWIEEKAVPVTAIALDEPEKMLVELLPLQPLTPGYYAIHWGALTGYDSIDPRVFLFEIIEPGILEGEVAESSEL